MIVIGGLGRCGTSLITQAFLPKTEKFVRRLSPYTYLSHDGIIKTHSLPPKRWGGSTKVIWCFGNPMDIVVSCLQAPPGFIVAHCNHLGGDTKNLGKIYDKDILGLDKHFTAWYDRLPVRMATVKYEKIYSHLDDIQAFIGMPMTFSAFRPRKSNWKKHWAAPWLEATYGVLAKRIEDAEDFKIW